MPGLCVLLAFLGLLGPLKGPEFFWDPKFMGLGLSLDQLMLPIPSTPRACDLGLSG